MEYRRMFIWVEGNDDVRFFSRVIEPMFKGKYDSVEIRAYRPLPPQKTHNFLKSIKAMNAGYIYVADINNAPCITAKKQRIQGELGNVDEDRIAIVVKEIEGWYLAGLDSEESRRLGVRILTNTDDLTKEQFERLIPRRFDSRLDFMVEVLRSFCIEVAKQKNRSFRYFLEKHDC